MKLANDTTDVQAAGEILRKYLVHSYPLISANYPDLAGLDPANAAEFLLHLQNTGRIRIELFSESAGRVGCRIIELDAVKE